MAYLEPVAPDNITSGSASSGQIMRWDGDSWGPFSLITWSGSQTLASSQDYILTHPAVTNARFFALRAESTPLDGLLLHFDGSNGATTTTDSSVNALTVTSVGGAALTTTSPKFGTASADFVGSNSNRWTISSTSALGLGTGVFTVSMWVYSTSFDSGSVQQLLDARSANNATPWALYVKTNGLVEFYDGTASYTSNAAPTNSQWNHIAVYRYQGSLYMSINGTIVHTTGSYTRDLGSSKNLYIGCQADSTTFLTGKIDELSIVKYARYGSSNFTPESAAFTNPSSPFAPMQVGVLSTASATVIGVQTLSTTESLFRPGAAGTYNFGMGQ